MQPGKKVSALLLSFFVAPAFAGVDKVYSPTVEYGELEIEARGIYDLEDDFYKTKLGVGYGFTDFMFLEAYLVGEKEDGEFEVEEAELEAKFQLSEQGEYWADFGLLVELEGSLEHDKYELKAGPIVQKQFGEWVATTNILLEKQFGDDKTEDEVEALGSFQLKYRMNEALEPAIEYYADEHTNAIGPVLLGFNRFSNSKMKWEFGVLFGLDDETPDATLRWLVEMEF